MIERMRLKQERAEPNRLAFTDLGISRLKHPKHGQELYWDQKSVGLSLLVGKRTKTFRSTYKLQGIWTSRKIGRLGIMSLADARATVLEDRKQAEQDIDPGEARPAPSTTSFQAVVEEFIKLYAKPRQRTWHQTENVLLRNCKPWLNKPIASITKRDAFALLDGFIAADNGPKAAVTLAWLRKLWRWAWQRDIVIAPIMDAVEIEFEKRVRDRIYSDNEIKMIWKAANKLEPIEGAYFKMLMLLAPRKSALSGMKWSEIKDGVWTTPFERTKSKKTSPTKRVYLTPLPPLAMRIIKGLPKTDGELVFPGRYQGLALKPDYRLLRKIVAKGAPKDFNYHAMRHTVASWLQTAGHSGFEIGLVLNHKQSGVTADYSHGYPLKLKTELLETWADHVEALVSAEGVALLR